MGAAWAVVSSGDTGLRCLRPKPISRCSGHTVARDKPCLLESVGTPVRPKHKTPLSASPVLDSGVPAGDRVDAVPTSWALQFRVHAAGPETGKGERAWTLGDKTVAAILCYPLHSLSRRVEVNSKRFTSKHSTHVSVRTHARSAPFAPTGCLVIVVSVCPALRRQLC